MTHCTQDQPLKPTQPSRHGTSLAALQSGLGCVQKSSFIFDCRRASMRSTCTGHAHHKVCMYWECASQNGTESHAGTAVAEAAAAIQAWTEDWLTSSMLDKLCSLWLQHVMCCMPYYTMLTSRQTPPVCKLCMDNRCACVISRCLEGSELL